MKENWYAVYTKPRWEKKVAEALTAAGIKNYCPLNRVIRQWSDRKKMVYEPLFSSYVFIQVTDEQVNAPLRFTGVINLVYWLGKPAIIRNVEIELIRNFLAEHVNVRLDKTTVVINDAVKVTKGALIDKRGTVVAIKNSTVKVALPALGYTMYAEIESSFLEKVAQES